MRDMDLKMLTEVGKYFPDPEPETEQNTRNLETEENVTKKRRSTK